MTDTPPNVVLLVLDTVRRDRVSAYGYERTTTPRFDRFARDNTLFTDAVTQSSWSIPAHASLLTGLYPEAHGATTVRPILQARQPLPAALSAAGYETYAVSPNEFVRPATGFGTGFDGFYTDAPVTVPEPIVRATDALLNRLTDSRYRRPLERGFNQLKQRGSLCGTVEPPSYGVASRVESIIEQSDEPFFLFANLPHAHLPRSPEPAYEKQFVNSGAPTADVVETGRTHTFGRQTMDSRALETMADLYDADLRTLDDRLSAVLDAVEGQTADRETLVVLVSDHGEHLGEHGLVGHHHSLLDPVVSVPLAIDFPGGGPDVVESQVETRRVYHTIADAAGVTSFPEISLRQGREDTVARGSFHSPMLDMTRFLQDRTVAYDERYLGEPLTFSRTPAETRFEFDDESWTATREEANAGPTQSAGVD